MAYTNDTFFHFLKGFVLEDMAKTGILASLTGAQAYIESSKGNSGLTQKANNLFGIKGSYQEIVTDREDWYAVVHGVTELDTT